MAKGVQASYDCVAEEYGRRYFHEFDHKPFDREILDRFAERVRGRGPVCDMGCGPGEVACYLCAHGVEDVLGIDISPGMVEQARKLNPGVTLYQGDMLNLEAEDGSWGGIAAFYSIIHIPRDRVVAALGEMRRVLKPEGLLLLTFHIGQELVHLDEWWGNEVSLDFLYFETEEMRTYMELAGFEIEEVIERDSYQDVEAKTRRAYVLARKPNAKEKQQ
ncbi:MAG: methyltransferase domain-containing protein [Anaerolineae bacterium]|nr:methyltransferase domain-containing protein [Anaerolineae bacterium]